MDLSLRQLLRDFLEEDIIAVLLMAAVIIVDEAFRLGFVNFGEFNRDPLGGKEKLPAIDLNLQTLR